MSTRPWLITTHRADIEADLAEGEWLYEELKAKQPSILEKIRLRQADGLRIALA